MGGDPDSRAVVPRDGSDARQIASLPSKTVVTTPSRGVGIVVRRNVTGEIVKSDKPQVASRRLKHAPLYEASVPRADLDETKRTAQAEFWAASRHVQSGTPVVVSGTGVAELAKRWPDAAAFVENIGQDLVITAYECPRPDSCVRMHDAAKNAAAGPASIYHVRAFPCQASCMTAREWLERNRHWKRHALCFEREIRPEGAGREHDTLRDALQTVAGCRALTDLLRAAGVAVRADGARVVALAAGMLEPPRRVHGATMIVQAVGSAEHVLVAPRHAFRGLYPYAVHHAYDGYSMVDWERPNFSRWPKARGVSGMQCTLGPGDALIVPPEWYVATCTEDRASVSLHVPLADTVSRFDKCAAEALLGRCIERWAVDLVGTRHARDWLLEVAASGDPLALGRNGRDVPGIGDECASVAATLYQHVRTADLILEEVHALVGERNVQDFFEGLLDRRLLPTRALDDAGLRDVMLLADKAERRADTRSLWAIRYPALFRHSQGR